MLFPTILALAVLARSVHGYAYQGCLEFANAAPGTDVTPADTGLDGCLADCNTLGFSYGFYQASPYGCRCSNSDTDMSNYQSAEDSSGTCSTDQASGWEVSTSFAFDFCASSFDSGSASTTFVSGAEECYSRCSPTTYGSLSRVDGVYICQCFNTLTSYTAATCGGSTQTTYIYQHAPNAAVSGTTRRQLKRRLENRRRTLNAFCPVGLTSCALAGDVNAFECVDTQSELESCGGCMGSVFGPVSRAPMPGVDCSALPGVAMGAVTCARGECLVSACKSGYALMNNRCVSL
ncbi:hypothetical protein IAR55_004428 [Kwoniella newhampshirensis]|uniref:Protein CPL1-like domain-containing protein n=1 Tax=Kwoniella newhampshirensis TaxID=1651941 RepID=A0AAW0YX65_9TREE